MDNMFFDINMEKLPKHIAIIMDGNGRWAKKRFLPRTAGHKAGVETVRTIITECKRLGIKHVTLYTFSTENWKRPALEVETLMMLLQTYLKKEVEELNRNNVRLTAIGDIEKLPKACLEELKRAMELTKNNDGPNLNLALNYGGRYDITNAVKQISRDIENHKLNSDDITEDKIKEVISTTYQLFPNIKGYLTNITITNAPSNEDYIAYFNPTNTFINNNLDIKEYNKVNKTEILLNSYYFLNKDILSKGLKENWYPNNASYESLIAHELGHYITFVTLLKQNNIDNITLVTKDNINSYQNILNILKEGTYSKELVEEAIESYNKKYNTNISLEDFTKNISGYASQKVKESVNYDEVIAEAIHDYYLHRDSSSTSSLEIINILKERLQ